MYGEIFAGDILNGLVIMSLLCLEIGLLSVGCLWFIVRSDKDNHIKITAKTYWFIAAYSALTGLWITFGLTEWVGAEKYLCGFLSAYLLSASITDWQTCEVYDFLHIFAGAAGIWFLWSRSPDREIWISLLCFLAVQLLLFMRMYGKADGMAFLVCAVYESVHGSGFLTYLLHMSAAYLLLGVVQGLRRNINRRGNLKAPVPFLPYIAATVWFFL